MVIEDTVELMLSESQADRMRAEYLQLMIRSKDLMEEARQWRETHPDYRPSHVQMLYREQLKAMQGYLSALRERCDIFGIDLSDVEPAPRGDGGGADISGEAGRGEVI